MSMNDGIQEWWSGVPLATRYLFSSAGAITLAANLGAIGVMKLTWAPAMIYQSFEIWRLITPFLFMGGWGISMVVNFVFLLRYSQQLEQGRFAGRLADYVFMLAFGAIFMLIIATFLGIPFLATCLVMFLIYVWARTNPNIDMSFLFGVRFKSAYFPWVLMIFNVLMGGSPVYDLIGIVVGHLYIYLKDIYPRVSGKYFIETPQFLINLLPPGTGINVGTGAVQQPQLQVPQRGYAWGAGNRLGGH